MRYLNLMIFWLLATGPALADASDNVPASLPEPGTLPLLVAGVVVGLALIRRRKK